MLLGLYHIRESLQITIKDLAAESGISISHLVRLQQGINSCSLDAIKRLSEALCCTANDLIDQPSPLRLAQIKMAYLQRAFKRAKAVAEQMEEEAS